MKMVKKPKGDMIIPDMVQNITPVTIPQMQFKQGLLAGWKHNWKLDQLVKESESQAKIAVQKNIAAHAWLDTVQSFQTYAVKTQLEFKRVAHEERMMEQEFTEKNLKNQLLYLECEKAKFEHRQMLKESGDGETIDL